MKKVLDKFYNKEQVILNHIPNINNFDKNKNLNNMLKISDLNSLNKINPVRVRSRFVSATNVLSRFSLNQDDIVCNFCVMSNNKNYDNVITENKNTQDGENVNEDESFKSEDYNQIELDESTIANVPYTNSKARNSREFRFSSIKSNSGIFLINKI